MKVCYARDYAAVSTDLRHISDIKSIDLHTSISVANLGSPYIIDFINYLSYRRIVSGSGADGNVYGFSNSYLCI